jgi:hypothetical protein
MRLLLLFGSLLVAATTAAQAQKAIKGAECRSSGGALKAAELTSGEHLESRPAVGQLLGNLI